MDLTVAARRYIVAVEALHTLHGSTDVHNLGGLAGQAITPHCALICRETGDAYDAVNNAIVRGNPPHKAELAEYYAAKDELEIVLLKE